MPKYPFLSDQWVAAAEALRDEYAGSGASPGVDIRMNQVVTEVPFGDGVVETHLDTSSGTLDLGLGHVDDAEVTVTLEYDTARSFFVDGNPQAAMQAFMAGKLTVQGDMTKLVQLMQNQTQSAERDEEVVSVLGRIRDITE